MNPARLALPIRTQQTGPSRVLMFEHPTSGAAKLAWQEQELKRLRRVVLLQGLQLYQHQTEQKAAEKLMNISLPNHVHVTQMKRMTKKTKKICDFSNFPATASELLQTMENRKDSNTEDPFRFAVIVGSSVIVYYSAFRYLLCKFYEWLGRNIKSICNAVTPLFTPIVGTVASFIEALSKFFDEGVPTDGAKG